MSALETFVLQFETKGSKMVLADIQQISEKTRKLESLVQKEAKATEDNTKKEEENTKARKKQTNQMTKQNRELWTLAKRLIGLGSIYAVLRKGWSLGIDFMKQGQGIKFMANSANMAAGAFQKWSAVAKKFGGNENSITSTMMGISSQIEEMRFGQVPMQEVAARYGIALPTTKDPEQFLLHLAKALEGRRPEEQRQIGRQMGFGEDIIRMLQLGYNGLSAELGKAQVKLNNAQLEKADKLNKAMTEVQERFSILALNIGAELAPNILRLSEIMAKLGDAILPTIHKLFKDKGLLEQFGEWLWEPSLAATKEHEAKQKAMNEKLIAYEIGAKFRPKDMANLNDIKYPSLAQAGISGASVVVSNQNNITLNGTEATPQAVGNAVATETKDSIMDISNVLVLDQQ